MLMVEKSQYSRSALIMLCPRMNVSRTHADVKPIWRQRHVHDLSLRREVSKGFDSHEHDCIQLLTVIPNSGGLALPASKRRQFRAHVFGEGQSNRSVTVSFGFDETQQRITRAKRKACTDGQLGRTGLTAVNSGLLSVWCGLNTLLDSCENMRSPSASDFTLTHVQYRLVSSRQVHFEPPCSSLLILLLVAAQSIYSLCPFAPWEDHAANWPGGGGIIPRADGGNRLGGSGRRFCPQRGADIPTIAAGPYKFQVFAAGFTLQLPICVSFARDPVGDFAICNCPVAGGGRCCDGKLQDAPSSFCVPSKGDRQFIGGVCTVPSSSNGTCARPEPRTARSLEPLGLHELTLHLAGAVQGQRRGWSHLSSQGCQT